MKIEIAEISESDAQAFFDEQIEYLVEDGIISDEDDIAYFLSDEYRSVIKSHMNRSDSKHCLVYFLQDAEKIGAASYCIYSREGGKCFILDFWIFRRYRNRGLGSACFKILENRTKSNGALYFEINCDGREDRLRFWTKMGFRPNGVDEYGVPLMIKNL